MCSSDLRQRRANVAGSDGAVEEMARIIAQIRQRWPRARIILRANSGFSNDGLMSWCETNRVDYVFGLARNRRLGPRRDLPHFQKGPLRRPKKDKYWCARVRTPGRRNPSDFRRTEELCQEL